LVSEVGGSGSGAFGLFVDGEVGCAFAGGEDEVPSVRMVEARPRGSRRVRHRWWCLKRLWGPHSMLAFDWSV
jgi:hypothetical protein